jgi:hypothetical protein
MTVLGVGGGIRFNPPNPQQGCGRVHNIIPTWTDMEMPQVKDDSIYVGHARVQCFVLTWWQGVFPVCPTSTNWVVHTRYHQHVKLNINVIYVALDNGSGRWLHAVFRPDFALGRRGYCCPPSTDWVGSACTLPSAHVAWRYLAWKGFILMIMAISKVDFKHTYLKF